MKTLIVILLSLAAALAIAYVAVDDPGYVLITLEPWSIELSFSLFVVLLVALFIAAYLLVRLLVRVWRAPKDVSIWRKRRRKLKAHKSQAQGMMGLIEGDWLKAEKKLVGYIGHTDTPVLNYLGAAHAAQAQGDFTRRDKYLDQAVESDPQQAVAIGLTRAKLQYQTGQLEQALTTLQKLRTYSPKNKRITGLIMQVYRDLQDWKSLSQLMPEARKLRVLPEETLEQLDQMTAQRLLTDMGSGNEQPQQVWNGFSRGQRKDKKLIAAYTEKLMEQGNTAEAERLLRRTLKQQWEPDLVLLYGKVKSPDVAKQLKNAEKWAESRRSDPFLLLTLARLSVANELWGKARSYFESCIENKGPAEAYQELGKLLERLEEPEVALEYYRRGMERSLSSQAAQRQSIENPEAPSVPMLTDSPLELDR